MTAEMSPLPVPGDVWETFRRTVQAFAIARLVVPGEPASKSRARFTKQYSKVHAYTPEKTKQAEEQVAWHFKKACPRWVLDPDGTFGIFALFRAQTFQRRDVDNMVKLAMDGLTGVVWVDDVQVAEASGRVERGVKDPHSEIFIYYARPNGTPPSSACEACGKRFRIYDSWKTRRFCTQACQDSVIRRRKTCICKGCGQDFTPGAYEHARLYCSPACRQKASTVDLVCIRCGSNFQQWTSWKPSGPVLCSRECGVAYWRENGTKSPKGTCGECGAPTSRKEYTRCRPCARAAQPPRTRAPRPVAAKAVLPAGSKLRYPKRTVMPGTPEWAARKQRALAFLTTTVGAGGNPSYFEIGQAIDLPAHGAVQALIAELRSDGWLTREPKKPFRYTMLRPITDLSPDLDPSLRKQEGADRG